MSNGITTASGEVVEEGRKGGGEGWRWRTSETEEEGDQGEGWDGKTERGPPGRRGGTTNAGSGCDIYTHIHIYRYRYRYKYRYRYRYKHLPCSWQHWLISKIQGHLKKLTIFICEARDRETTLSFCWITMAMRELFKNKKLLLRRVKYGKSKRPVPIWKRGGGSWKERVIWERVEGTENVCYIKPMSGRVSSL